MEYLLFALRILMALALLSFLAAILFLLLREQSQSAITPTSTLAFPRPAQLIALEPEQDNPRTFELTRNTWMGRDPNSFVYVDDAPVSARHAQLVWDDEGQAWFIEDNASRNGTFVNTARVVRQLLAEGDVVQIGSARFAFRLAATHA